MEFDAKDRQLLSLLERDAKAPAHELAQATGIPPSTVHHRIKRLEQQGVIERYAAQLDPKQVGRGFAAFIMVTGSPEKYLDDDFFEHNYVTEVAAVTGSYDLVIKIECPGLQEFNEFLQQFREKYGKYVSQTVTMVCTETLVH